MTQRTYEKAVEMDPTFGQQKETPVLAPQRPRREFDPEADERFDEHGHFIPAYIRRLRRGNGQGLAEYALILALIAIVAIIALAYLGTQISGFLDATGQSI